MFTWNTIGIIDVPSMLAITHEAWLRNPTTVINQGGEVASLGVSGRRADVRSGGMLRGHRAPRRLCAGHRQCAVAQVVQLAAGAAGNLSAAC